MEPTSPFYPLSPSGYGLHTPGAFTWDLNSGMAGRELVPLATKVSTPNAAYSLPILSSCSPLPVPTNPLLWTKDDVECWIRWCIAEFSLSNLDTKSFSMNGKALCLLPKESFTHRTAQSGDVLYEILQKLIYYNGYLNRQSDIQEPRYQTGTLLQPAANRLSPNQSTAPTPDASLLHPSSFHHSHHIQRSNNRSAPNINNDNIVTSSRDEHRDEHRPGGRGLTSDPLNHKNTDNHPSTPCSDSGHSSPGMVEEDANQQPTAHPLSRNAMTSHCPSSHQIRLGHHTQSAIGQQCRQGNKRHYSVSEIENPECMSPIKKMHTAASMNNLGLKGSMHAQYMMPHGRIGLHESSMRLPNAPESGQRSASDRAEGSHHRSHPHSRQVDPLHHSRHHDNEGSRMFPGYPIPMPLPYLDSCVGRNRAMYFGTAEENGGLYRHHDDDVETLEDDIFSTGEKPSDCRLLWEFLSQLLKQEKYAPYIKWEDEETRVFRIQDPTAIASLWGRQKNRTNMTYEKLSRALRYYYKTGILQKEPGQKLTYRFLQDPEDIANAQRCSKANRSKTGADASPSSTSPEVYDTSSHSTDEDSSPHKDQSATGDSAAAATNPTALDTDDDSVESVSSDDDTVEEMVPTVTLIDAPRSVCEETNVDRRRVDDLRSKEDSVTSFVVGSPEVADHCVLIKEEPAI